jgi:hypothetical protein
MYTIKSNVKDIGPITLLKVRYDDEKNPPKDVQNYQLLTRDGGMTSVDSRRENDGKWYVIYKSFHWEVLHAVSNTKQKR